MAGSGTLRSLRSKLFVDVLLVFQTLYQALYRRFRRVRSSRQGKLHFFNRAVIVPLGHRKPRSFRADQPVIRIFLDVGAEDFKCLVLLARQLELPLLTQDAEIGKSGTVRTTW